MKQIHGEVARAVLFIMVLTIIGTLFYVTFSNLRNTAILSATRYSEKSTPIDSGGLYSRSSFSVFYSGHKIANADAQTFAVLSSSPPVAKDIGHVYVADQTIHEADPKTFHLDYPDFYFAQDNTNLFFLEYEPGTTKYQNVIRPALVKGADPTSFVNDWHSYDPGSNVVTVAFHDAKQRYRVRLERTDCGGDISGCILKIVLQIIGG